jgi:hypothetical protein
MAVIGNLNSLSPADITQPTNVARPPCSSADHGTGNVSNAKMSPNVAIENGGGNSMSWSTYVNWPICNASVCLSRICGAVNFVASSDLALPNFSDSKDVNAGCHLEQKDKLIELLLEYTPSCSLKSGKHKIYENKIRLIDDSVIAHISRLIPFISCPVDRGTWSIWC